jgi:hypothetical protein
MLLTSCKTSNKIAVKSNIKLLEEFRTAEYRGYIVKSIDNLNKKNDIITLFNEANSRGVKIKISKEFARWYSVGDTIK